MKNFQLFISMLFCCFSLNAFSQKDLKKFAATAVEPGIKCFVVYENGDSLKGESLIKNHNRITGKVNWFIDTEEVVLKNIGSYQDEDGYRIGKYYYTGGGGWSSPEYVRVIRGNISLFYRDISTTIITASAPNGKVIWVTYFYLKKGNGGLARTTTLMLQS